MAKRFRLGAAALTIGLLAAACGSDGDGGGSTEETTGGTAAAVEGGAITIALGSEPTSLDPHLVDDGGERAINDNIYETLLTRDAEGTLQPGLATELPTQVDDTTWEFKLREGVTFHDGTPFNADSVVATVNRMVKLVADAKTDNDGFFGSLTGAEKVDDTTVRIMTAEPDGVLPARMYWLKIIPASAEESPDLSDAPNGTGPYVFDSYSKGSQLKLTANPDYWDEAPAISDVTYEFVSEAGTRLAGLKSGKYNLITNLAPQDVEQAPAAAQVQGQEHPILILDADDGITADPDVRKALNLAVDKDAIAETVFGGYAVVDKGQLLSPSILGFNESMEPYGYDPDQAKQILEDKGLAGQTIQLVGESGRWLNDRELLEAIAGFWTDAGLQVDLQILEFGEYLDVLFDRENRADVIYVSSSNDILDADRQLSTYYQAGGIGSSNSDQELSDLIDQGRSELESDAREKTYNDAVQLAYDNAYFVWLVNNEDLYGLSENMSWTPRVDAKLLVKEMSVTG
ncbi:MAG TPA: ABC transporter substrate-binding protein [Acidimicrobiales bacterium]|nr:ABC transporter substrate-binding protein [Acidimicrobiales bacterium]